jgi:hypothetical protein
MGVAVSRAIFLVQGTEGWQVDDPDPKHPRNWWRLGSLLVDMLITHDFQLIDPDDPFVWTTELDGLAFWQRWKWFRSRRDKRGWLAGGKAARWYAVLKGYLSLSPRLSAEERAIVLARPRRILVMITHSHGLQLALNAANEGLVIDYLLDIAGPVRADVLEETRDGLKNIGHWMHVTAEDGDLIQVLGRIGDGHVGAAVELPKSVRVVPLPGISHSELLANPTFVPSAWERHGLLAFLLEGRDG